MINKNSKFKFLEHTADIKFQAFGKSVEEMFENSALAIFNAMYNGKIKEKKIVKIKARGKDFESLLYNFLEELLILFDGEGFFLAKVENLKIDKKNFKLKAEVIGDDASNYKINIDVKAITYHEMFVKKKASMWVCQVVVDV